jgi:ATP-dependent exoDNAse (exonuclease V) beta subunit
MDPHQPYSMTKKDATVNRQLGLLEKQNPHERDARIEFNSEDHEYFIDGVKATTSVSQVIGDFFPKFKTEFWSKKKARERGVPVETVLKEWKDKGDIAANLGTFLHEQIENYYNEEEYDGTSIEFKYFLNFSNKYPSMEPFRTEWRIFDETLMLAGTIDMVYLNPQTGKYFLFDWKRSEKVVDGQGSPIRPSYQYASDPIAHLSDNSYNKYSLQQNLYKHLLEKNYGITISSINLLVLHPNRHGFQVVSVPDMKKEVIDLLTSYSER